MHKMDQSSQAVPRTLRRFVARHRERRHRGRVLFYVAGIVLLLVSMTSTSGQPAATVPIDGDDIGGVVSGPQGPEAGVWVIAETTDLPTRFVRIVVTDDRGRYVLPDLPKANYQVWARGYGLVDSSKIAAAPGKLLNLTAVAAPSLREAAQFYPAGYWFALLTAPEEKEFPGNAASGINPEIKSQAQWLRQVKSGGCLACHALGTKATREIPLLTRKVRLLARRVGPTHPVGSGGTSR